MPRLILAGCGFAGLATARLFAGAGWEVLALTLSAESAGKLAGEPFRVAVCDISLRENVERLAGERGAEVVIHCASSGRGGAEAYRAVYLEGSRNLLDVLTPRRFIFTSSTSVYAQTDGGWVSEESAAEPPRETGRILCEVEQLALANGGIVTRLAGIYGPGRSVLLRKFFSGEAVIEGDGLRVVNHIHRDDIASALHVLAERGEAGIYNVCDDRPTLQREIYEWLAGRFARAMPPSGPVEPNRKRGWTSKQVGNAKLRALGWVPRYGCFFDAVGAELELVRLAQSGSGLDHRA